MIKIHLQKWGFWLIVMGLSFLLISCSSDDSELTHYINKIKSRRPKPIEPIPDFEQLPKFTYPEGENRRSPFKPIIPKQQADLFAPNIKRPKQPLESFPLDALKFVGILKEDSNIWALIAQPGGMVTRVKMGDYMGQNYGQVISIKDKIIKIQEALKIGGKWEKKDISMSLKAAE